MAVKEMTKEQLLAYKDKDASPTQVRYADWLVDKLDLEFPNTKAQAAFYEAVRLATALRMIFQASPENQGVRAETRAEREARTAEKDTAKKTAKPTPVADDDDDEPAPTKAKPGRKPGKKAAAAVPDAEDSNDETVAPAAKPTAPKKAARSGKPVPF